MGQYCSNIDLFPVKMNGRNEPIFVSANIEYDQAIDIIGIRKVLSQLAERIVVGLPDDVVPAFQ